MLIGSLTKTFFTDVPTALAARLKPSPANPIALEKEEVGTFCSLTYSRRFFPILI